MEEVTKETLFYDKDGRRTTPDRAVKAEIIHRTKSGTVVKIEYYDSVGRKS